MPESTTPSSVPSVLDEWVSQLATELGLPASVVDIGLVLDLARDAAHGIARPAAPLTTFLVGYAAAAAGGSPEDVRRIAAIATELANDHSATAE
ncbi:MAG: DUF6457 domain-containing protein [Cryobacterium sp.]